METFILINIGALWLVLIYFGVTIVNERWTVRRFAQRVWATFHRAGIEYQLVENE